MSWEDYRFLTLEKIILKVIEGKSVILDVPYFRYRYDPSLEERAIEEFKNLHTRLVSKGFSSEIIWTNKLLLESLEEIDKIENLIKYESENRQQVFNTLSNINHGLPMIMTK